MNSKLFTWEEANELIPFLDFKMPELLRLKKSIEEILIGLRQKNVDVKELFSSPDNFTAEMAGLKEKLEHLGYLFNRTLNEIQRAGCMVKDVELGLVDFVGLNEEGKEILLCWQYGEKEIRYWHSIDEGFTGRKPLNDRNENVSLH